MILNKSTIEHVNRELVQLSMDTDYTMGYPEDDFMKKCMLFHGVQISDLVDILNSIMKLSRLDRLPKDFKYGDTEITESYLTYLQEIKNPQKSAGISFNLIRNSENVYELEIHKYHYPAFDETLKYMKSLVKTKNYKLEYEYSNTFKSIFYVIPEDHILSVLSRIRDTIEDKEYLNSVETTMKELVKEQERNITLSCNLGKDSFGNNTIELRSSILSKIENEIYKYQRVLRKGDKLVLDLADGPFLHDILCNTIENFRDKFPNESNKLLSLEKTVLKNQMEDILLKGDLHTVIVKNREEQETYQAVVDKYAKVSNPTYSEAPVFVINSSANQLEMHIETDYVLYQLFKNLSTERTRIHPIAINGKDIYNTRIMEKSNLEKIYRTTTALGYTLSRDTENHIISIIGAHYLNNNKSADLVAFSSYRTVRMQFPLNMQLHAILNTFKSYKFDYNTNYHEINIVELEAFIQRVDFMNTQGSELNRLNYKPLKDILANHKEMMTKYKDIAIFDTSRLKVQPFEYQIEGAKFLIDKMGCILGDEMGLGKTKTSLIAARSVLNSKLLSRSHNRIAIIVTPNTVKLNWAKEIQKVDPFAKTLVIIAGQKFNATDYIKNGVPLFNYIVINFDNLNRYLDQLAMLKPTCLIVDEAHKCTAITNDGTPGTIRAANLIALSELVPFVWLLTGTPFRNKAIELFNLLVCINHDLALSFKSFTDSYSAKKKTGAGTVYSGFKQYEELNEKLKQKMLRRKKKEIRDKYKNEHGCDLLNLPDKDRNFFPVEIDQNAYNNAVQIFMENCSAESSYAKQLVIMGALKKYLSYAKIPHTFEIAYSIVTENEDEHEPIVIFSDYKKPLNDLKYLFEKEKISCCKITGDEDEFEKQRNIEDFAKGKYRVALCSMKAAGVGTTLVKAKNLIFNDLTWVPFDHFQAEDRVHRVGQTSDVSIYYIYCENASIDARLAEKLEAKAAEFDAVVDGGTGEHFTVSLMAELYDEFKDKFNLGSQYGSFGSLSSSLNTSDVLSDQLIMNALQGKIKPGESVKSQPSQEGPAPGSALAMLLASKAASKAEVPPLPREDTVDPIIQLQELFKSDLANVTKIYRKVDISDNHCIYEVALLNKKVEVVLTYRLHINTLYDNTITAIDLMRITKTSKRSVAFDRTRHAQIMMQGELYDKVFAKLMMMSVAQQNYTKEIIILKDAFEKNPNIKVVIPVL